jgi:hypothetical protein
MPETVQRKNSKELGLTIIVIILSGASASLLLLPPLGIIPYATFRDIAIIPSVVIIFAIGILTRSRFPRLTNRLFAGMAAGTIASFALEAIRIPAYMFAKWMPMDSMISLPGLLLTEKITMLSQAKQVIMQSGVPMNLYTAPMDVFLVGGLWHFWNGATFGIIYALLIGKGKWWYGVIWAVIIEMVMMVAPYLIIMVGPFGTQYKDGYNIFVITLIAHVIFGAVLGIIVQKWKKGSTSIINLGKGE